MFPSIVSPSAQGNGSQMRLGQRNSSGENGLIMTWMLPWYTWQHKYPEPSIMEFFSGHGSSFGQNGHSPTPDQSGPLMHFCSWERPEQPPLLQPPEFPYPERKFVLPGIRGTRESSSELWLYRKNSIQKLLPWAMYWILRIQSIKIEGLGDDLHDLSSPSR